MKCLMIVNPVSGKRTMQPEIKKLAGELVMQNLVQEFEVYYTKGCNDVIEFLRTKNKEDYDFLLSAGGDGTQNEVISAIIETNFDIPVLMVAGGTVNDFANFLGIPTKAKDMVKLIKDFHTERIDVGRANGRVFMNVLAAGMFADVAYKVDKEQKAKFGPLAYYATGAIEFPEQIKRKMDLHIKIDDQDFDVKSYLFMVTNSNSIGGFKIATKASAQDGMFDVLAIKQCSVTDLIALYKDIQLNKHENSPFLFYEQGSHIEITTSTKDIVLDFDGEQGDALPVTIDVLHNAVSLILPKKN